MPDEILNTQVIPGNSNLLKSATNARIFFVDSTGTGSAISGGLHPAAAFTTLAKAIAACTAAKGDTIYVMPGHAESFSGAAALNINIAGIRIIGLGSGANRPTFTWHTTDALVTVSAANVTIKNIICTTDVDAVATLFSATTGSGLTFDTVDFVETAACACLQFLLTVATADFITIQNCTHIQMATAATALQRWIVLTGADNFKAVNNFVSLKGYATANPANSIITGLTTANLNILLKDNTFVTTNSTGAIPINLNSGTTGFARGNTVASAKSAIAGSIALASVFGALNYAGHVVNTNGLLEPVVDA